jgi:hypothetical protein
MTLPSKVPEFDSTIHKVSASSPSIPTKSRYNLLEVGGARKKKKSK